ncbi:hypothetical protein BDV29DRAFT_181833 [Aspergillus leporis]|uniref:Uncharacterized protein n=1 Tax=Aspergillus leporis TaxID=41062 RepID=A0A5N5WNU9_9EURO|nr:hypothetical protein BDV29DRAFT_181833 [Aspergillus leporis]
MQRPTRSRVSLMQLISALAARLAAYRPVGMQLTRAIPSRSWYTGAEGHCSDFTALDLRSWMDLAYSWRVTTSILHENEPR